MYTVGVYLPVLLTNGGKRDVFQLKVEGLYLDHRICYLSREREQLCPTFCLGATFMEKGLRETAFTVNGRK